MATSILTEQDILNAVDTLKEMDVCNGPFNPIPRTVLGMPVYETPPPPQKIKLSKDIDVTDEFREEFDLWLASRFGFSEPLLKGDQWLVSRTFGFVVAPHGGLHLLENIY